MSRDWDKLGRALEAVWEEASSLPHAFDLANSGMTDVRNMHRARRKLEALGFTLPSIKEKYVSEHFTECPSLFERKKGVTNFVITSCTNNSPLCDEFLDTLELFASDKDAQVMVVPVNYKNVTIMHSQDDYKWPERIYEHAVLDDEKLSDQLMVSAARIRATAVNPLQGKQPIGKTSSVIYGHPQLAMEMVAAPASETPKMMHTTGSVNYPCYSATDTGIKAEFHHSMSAVFVRIVGDKFYLTQLCWDGEGFNYFRERWNADGRQEDESIAGLHMGDYHAFWAKDDVVAARERLLAHVDPEVLIWNDLHDHASQSHHHTFMDTVRVAKSGDHKVEDEIMIDVEHVNLVGAGRKNIIVQSNHDDALTKWLNRFHKNPDPHNAEFYWKLMAKWYDNMDTHPLELAMQDHLVVDYEFIGRNDDYKVANIDVTQHGDVGPNGSRGSAVGFAKTMYKTILGHSHSPRIHKGCWQNGTSTDNMKYKQGYSSWMLSDIMIYRSGRAAYVFYIDGEY